jgi:hypothetical protein
MARIVVEFGNEVQEYARAGLERICVCPDGCPSCLVAGQMIGHGYYQRQPKDGGKGWVIRIKRWLCKACGQTVSILPSFLLRFRHYLLEVIGHALALRFEKQASWAGVMAGCSPQGLPAERTVQRWCRSYGEQAGRWLGAVQSSLAVQDSSSAWLDAHGEAPHAENAGQALLTASEHLLSWAKTQWAQLANHGLEKRLQFLWFWGASQGLGRLV